MSKKSGLPQSYAITKSTPKMVEILREAFMNNKGKLFTIPDLQKLTGKKWINGFLFYASRETLDPNAAPAFNIAAVKKGRNVVGYRYEGLVLKELDTEKGPKYRNTKGHVVKPTGFVGKWEARQTMIDAQVEVEAAA